MGDYNNAIECQSHSLEVSTNLGDKKGIAINISNIGDIQKTKGDYKEALNQYNDK